jgi:hypothetical protein
MRAIDTNVLVSAIVNDDAVQSARAVAFLSEGCKDFTTLDADLFKLATREAGVKDRDVVKTTPAVIRL